MVEPVKFSVKFKGQVYDDAHRDTLGHIRFGGNQYEWVPQDSISPSYVKIYGDKKVGPGHYVTTIKKSSAKLSILNEPTESDD